jgi:DNA primase
MPIYVRGRPIDVDIVAELEQFDWGYRAKWGHERLTAQSPFRDDSSPSFYVYLEDTATAPAGSWGDSGGEGDYAKGNFVKLLAFLRNEDEESTEEYLAETYGVELDSYDEAPPLDLSRIKVERSRQALDPAILDRLKFRHPYLGGRGISEKVQRLFNIGYDRATNAVSIPWFLPGGKLATIKYRSVSAKTFWYAKGGVPVKDAVYGIDLAYRFNWRKVVAVESETDAMASVQAGVPAIAMGGSSFNAIKRDIIARSPIEELVIAADNDGAGAKLARQMTELLRGYIDVRRATFPEEWGDLKDVNDVVLRKGADAYREWIVSSEKIYTIVNVEYK